MFVIDTDVISEGSPKEQPRADIRHWLRQEGTKMFLSVVTLAELRRGIEFLRWKGATRKAMSLDMWERELASRFEERILPLDSATAVRAGELLGMAEAKGHMPGLIDAFIAATADLRGFTVVTLNRRHFRALGVAHREPSFSVKGKAS